MIGADHIGDLLWLSPSLPWLRAGLPQCDWHVVASHPGSEVLEGNPHLAGILRPRFSYEHILGDVALLREIAKLRFDVALCYNTAGYWRDLLVATFARIPSRVGYVHKGLSGFVTFPIRVKFPQSYPAYFRDLVAQLTGLPGQWPLRPMVYPSADDYEAAQKVWEEEVRPKPNIPVVAVFFTSRQRIGTWPPERFAEAVAQLSGTCRVRILFLGSASDEPLLRTLQDKFCPAARVLAGRLNLRAMTVLLTRCTLALTMDSGPRHLANAAGIPVVFLRNLWTRRAETGPYLPTETDIAPSFECIRPAPCNMAQLRPSAGEIAQYLTQRLRETM